jgi:hypothetical protein
VWTTFDGLGETGDGGGVCNVQKLLRRRNQACQGRRRRRGIVFHVTLSRSRTPPHRLRIPAMQARPGCNTNRRRRRGQPNDWTWPRFARHYAVYGCCTLLTQYIGLWCDRNIAACTGRIVLHRRRRRDAAARICSPRAMAHGLPSTKRMYMIYNIMMFIVSVVYDWREHNTLFPRIAFYDNVSIVARWETQKKKEILNKIWYENRWFELSSMLLYNMDGKKRRRDVS